MRQRPLLCVLLVWIPIAMYGQTETRERRPEPGDEFYGVILREVLTYEGGEVISIDTYFTDEEILKNGRVSQSQIMLGDTVREYGIEFSDEYASVWGIHSAGVELGAGGQQEGIEYRFANGELLEFRRERLPVIQRYPPRMIHPIIADRPQEERNPDRPLMVFDTRALQGSTIVDDIPSEAVPIAPNERELIRQWLLQIGVNDISAMYNHKIEVIEQGQPVVLMVYDPLLDGLLERESTLVYYHHVGFLDNQAITIVVGFYEYGY